MKKTYKNNRLGWTAEYVSHSDQFKITNGTKLKGYTAAELIIGNPDWVEEKDFVITAFKYKSEEHKHIINLLPDGLYQGSTLKFTLQELLNYGSPIFSVLSNGIEFKIGDMVQVLDSQFVINSFSLFQGMMLVKDETGGFAPEIKSITPAKKVILTTEDGYTIDDPEQILFYVAESYAKNKMAAKNYRITQTGKWYLSGELAESYISKNKKKYSENDIRDACSDMPYIFNTANNLITKLNENK